MGYNGKLFERMKAQKMRKAGKSYSEILKYIDVSKDTLSRWCRDIRLTDQQKTRLIQLKNNGQKKGSIIAAENKRDARIQLTKNIFEKAKQEVKNCAYKEEFFIGVALYAAEGDKNEGRVGFVNSDPKLLKFMMKWFIRYTQLPLSKFRGAIWLHEGLNEQKAKLFWSSLSGIPLTQFHKTYIASLKPGSRKNRKNIHEYGVFAIRSSDTNTQRRILGWISAVFDGKISLVH